MIEKETEGIELLKHYAADADGRVILTRLAESIRVANQFERRRWSLTARHHGGWTVTLRIGRTQAIILLRDEVEIHLLPGSLSDDDREVLERSARKKDGPFEQVPGSMRYSLDWPKAVEVWGTVEAAHHEVLQFKRPRTGSENPEANALIDFLNRELKLERELPYPIHRAGPGGAAGAEPPVPLLQAYTASDNGRAILRATARSIEVANAESPAGWGTTVDKGGTYVALNVSNACAIRLHEDRVRVLLLPDRLEAEVRHALEDRTLHSWARPRIPGAHNYELDWQAAVDMWGSLEDAHHAALTASPHRKNAYHRSHSDEVIDFLNRELGLALPYPGYRTSPGADGPRGSDQESTAGPGRPQFRDLVESLEARGLLFPTETVANYVLALQTKRFAILTGISGTGKTQIAKGIARHVAPAERLTGEPALRQILNRISPSEDEELSQIVGAKEEVIGRFQPIFSDEHLSELTAGEFKSFLRYENNKHWTGIARYGGRLTEDMDALRSALRILFDESRPLRRRLQELRPDSGTPLVNGLGRATLTPLLLIRFPDRYGVLNSVAEHALKTLDLWPNVGPSAGFADCYISVNNRLLELAEDLDIDLWTLDSLWWRVKDGPSSGAAGLGGSDERRQQRYEVVPVRPDWVDNRGLLGYLNPITGAYSMTPFLSLLLEARDEEARAKKEDDRPPHPFFVVLDEMNLARVEHYFSDFLSALESDEPIPLHGDEAIEDGSAESGVPVPRQLRVPKNVFFTGTVNVDETTYMFSPKVLDRAFTIEFDQVDLEGYTDGVASSESGNLDLSAGRDGALRFTPYEKPDRCDWLEFTEIAGGRYTRILMALHAILEEEHRHFGYRVANEIARFVNLAREQAANGDESVKAAFDLALLQKVLPKFHGTQQELESLLERLFDFAVHGRERKRGDADVRLDEWTVVNGRLRPKGGSASRVPAGTSRGDADGSAGGTEGAGSENGTDASDGAAEGPDPEFPRTAAKVWRMLRRLNQRGFTSFIE
ncbi:MAG: hypothetical protein OXN85_03490 [Gemmatimonadetes bacterium]|nr:hypothetical protein [Candidatus Palauibacter australiensis]